MPAPFNSTRSSASVPSRPESRTLPPYFTTTVFPCQALTYRSPWAITAPCSVTAGGLGDDSGIFPHVFLGKIAGVDRGLPAAEPEVHRDLHIVAGKVLTGLFVPFRTGGRDAAFSDDNRSDSHQHPVHLHICAGVTDRSHDPSPTPAGPAAVDGRLHQG